MYHTSILDTDLYKFTMQYAVLQKYPRIRVRYDFINRDNTPFPEGFGKRLREIVNSYESLHLRKDERDFLREKCYYLPRMYSDFLSGYRYDPSEVVIIQEGPKLICFVEGDWYRTILWEVPLMETISELYFEMIGSVPITDLERRERNRAKAIGLKAIGAMYSEFGARRRYSYLNQRHLINNLKEDGGPNFLGTSNVHMAHIHNLIPMGTHAHEWFSVHGAIFGYQMATEEALKAWSQVYQGDLGIALPDTYTTDVFLRSFNTFHAKLFDGLRHDSDDPITWTDKVVKHYQDLRVNPETKVGLYSDNLNSLKKIEAIHNACKGRLIDRYGPGTWFSNDVGVKPLNIVIKLTGCNFNGSWKPTVKLSDSPTKNTGDQDEIKLCKQVLKIQ